MCTGIPESVAAVDSAAAIFSAYHGVEAASTALTLADFGTAAMIGSSVISGASAIDQAISGSQAAEANAKMSKQVSARNAQIIRQQQAVDQRIADQKFAREQASRRTWFGMTGGGGDSAAEVLAGAASAHELDMLTSDYNTDLAVENVLAGGDADAALYRLKSSNSLWQGGFNAGSTLLSGGANAIRYRLDRR